MLDRLAKHVQSGENLHKRGLRILMAVLFAGTLLACEETEEPGIDLASGPDEPADIELSITQLRYKFIDGRHRFYHLRAFTAHNHTGATITKGRVCVENGDTCVEAMVNYRVEGNSRFEQKNSYFATHLPDDRVTLEYWLTDDTGQDFTISKSVRVISEKTEPAQ